MDLNELYMLDSQTDTARQNGWLHRQTYVDGGERYRLTFKQDFYEFQSDYYAELWTPRVGWVRVHTLSSSDWYKRFPSSLVKSEQDFDFTVINDAADQMITYVQALVS